MAMGDEPKRYLTDAEVGALISKSTGQVARLRLRGAFPYIPGRPVLTDRADVEAWLAAQKAASLAKTEKARLATRPWSQLNPAEQLASARAWALRKKMKFPRIKRGPKKQPGAP